MFRKVPLSFIRSFFTVHIPLLCVQWKNSWNGQRNCPKHAEFYSKTKFEKSVYLVGFIVRTLPMFRICSLQLQEKSRSVSSLYIYFYSIQFKISPSVASDFTTYNSKFRIRKFSFRPMDWVYELCAYFRTNRHYLPIEYKLQMYIMKAKCHNCEVRT